jgi:flagellar hook assembly protein FlgD
MATASEPVTIEVADEPVSVVSVTKTTDPFSPNGDGRKDSTQIAATFNHTVQWTLTIEGVGRVVRTFAGSGASFQQIWDGKDGAGLVVPDGSYFFNVRAVDVGGSTVLIGGTVAVDRTSPAVANLTAAPDEFAPRKGQMTTIAFSLSETAVVTIKIFNSAGTNIRTLQTNLQMPAGNQAVVWDGKTGSGVYAAEGKYTYKVWVEDPAGNRASPYPASAAVKVK